MLVISEQGIGHIIEAWLKRFNAALTAGDKAALAALFRTDSHWRDIVALGRRILGKPADAAEATRMLSALSGRTHQVFTAVAVAHAAGVEHDLKVSRVRFAPLGESVIQAYVATGEPFDKAGGYAIQGPMAGWIAHIEGSYSGIMGLPLHETARLLRAAGVRSAL